MLARHCCLAKACQRWLSELRIASHSIYTALPCAVVAFELISTTFSRFPIDFYRNQTFRPGEALMLATLFAKLMFFQVVC
jgi:hypothetical protein